MNLFKTPPPEKIVIKKINQKDIQITGEDGITVQTPEETFLQAVQRDYGHTNLEFADTVYGEAAYLLGQKRWKLDRQREWKKILEGGVVQ